MAVISLTEMPKLKELIRKYGYNIYLHDTCGGQSFTLEKADDNTDNQVYEEIEKFFSEHKMTVNFYDNDKLNFVAK